MWNQILVNLKPRWRCPLQSQKKELQAFCGIINYLSKFSPSTAEVHDSLRYLTSAKAQWTWNASYQRLFDKANSIMKKCACMKFHDEKMPLYLETDATGVGFGATLVQTRFGTRCPRDEAPDNNTLRPKAFSCKSLSAAERKYSNRGWETLAMLHYL